MLILVALYLAVRLENLSDCNVEKEQQIAQIVAPEGKVNLETAVEP